MLNKKSASAIYFTKPISRVILLPVILLCFCFVISCGDKENDVPTPPVKKPTVLLATSATLGSYLTDTLGNTVYYFSNDYNGQSNCTGGCLNVWPVYYAGELTAASLGTGLDLADFATITTSTGAKQTTYKSWPLYYYAPASGGANVRESPGQTTGEGVGNIWYVAKPDYTVMLVNAQLTGNDGKSYKSDYTEGTGKTLYFSDAKGVTLYGFAKDSANLNKFTKADFSNNSVWPIYEMDKMVVPSTLDKTLFSITDVFGKKQLSYNGWPMYYFGADSLIRGLNKGVSVPVPKVWPAMVKDAPAAPAP
jgi:predicted lipoprotein with Yx(FWY)xxD motif